MKIFSKTPFLIADIGFNFFDTLFTRSFALGLAIADIKTDIFSPIASPVESGFKLKNLSAGFASNFVGNIMSILLIKDLSDLRFLRHFL